MRTLVDVTSDQVKALAELCARVNQPRAALIREAITEYLDRHQPPADEAFGLWGKDAQDGLAYQDKVRAEW